MAKEHRREIYSPVSATARQLPDVFGPDRVRVTLRVEPAVDRLRRWRFMLSAPPVLTQPFDTYVSYRILPGLIQKYVLRNRWAVDIEADSGEHCRIRADSRGHAIYVAREVSEGVQHEGVAFLRTITY